MSRTLNLRRLAVLAVVAGTGLAVAPPASAAPPTATIRIRTVDARTSAPVPGFCVRYFTARLHNADQDGGCADGAGLDLTGLRPDRYRIFVGPSDGVHGAQFVGPRGGTGDMDAARVFTVRAGQTLTITVRLDGAGNIEGTIRTLQPPDTHELCVQLWPIGPEDRGLVGFCSADTGDYFMSGLGPYDWKVHFPDRDRRYAWLWSGDAGSRDEAKPVRVRVGRTTVLNPFLHLTGRITGTVTLRGGGSPAGYAVTAVDADTGDNAAFAATVAADGTFDLSGGLANQSVFLFVTPSLAAPDVTFQHPQKIKTDYGRTVSGVDITI
jgi:hypothetical protein